MTTQEVKDVFDDVNELLMLVKMSMNRNDDDTTYMHIIDVINKYAEATKCALEVMDLMDSRLDIENGKDGEG